MRYTRGAESATLECLIGLTIITIIITFCVSRRRRKSIVVTRVCVCVSVRVSVAAIRPHYCTDPDVTWGIVEATP